MGGCEDTSACQAIFDVGLDNPSMGQIKIYPNPTHNMITIEYEGTFEFEILNMLGEVVLEGKGKNKKEVKLSSFEAGTYLVRINDEEYQETIHLTKL